eukprot:SAG11_NODE_6318_length_1338_cov_1.159806_1_plen_198_part_01
MLAYALLGTFSALSLATQSSAVPATEPPHWRNSHLSSGAVVQLEASQAAFLEIQDLATDIWQTRVLPNRKLAMDVQVRHDWLEKLRTLAGVNQSSFEIVQPDLLGAIEAQKRARRCDWNASAVLALGNPHLMPSEDPFFDEFRPQPQIEQWMELLAARNPALVRCARCRPGLGRCPRSRPRAAHQFRDGAPLSVARPS